MADLVDTIVALATPPGRGALAVVRLSGDRADEILRTVVPELDGVLPPARQARLARIVDPQSGATVDRGLVLRFPAPASYTGEHVVEFSGHGGDYTPRRVLDAFVAAGARPAEPGEFTRRAYLNGKLDLVQAEAVADLIEGTSRAANRVALRQLDRHLSRRVAALRDRILDLEAVLAHHIDFPEEDEPPVEASLIAERARRLAGELAALAATAPEGERLRSGALVVLAGRPNTGKSSLYNALLGEDRALVTDVPGTTRDALEADVSMNGYPVRLVDTAGLRDSEGRVERLGIEVALRFLEHADLVLHCVPMGREPEADEVAYLQEAGASVLEVSTMSDRVPSGAAGRPIPGAGVAVSAVTGEGIDALRDAVVGRLFGRSWGDPDEGPILTRPRQARAVESAAGEMAAFADDLANGVPAEFAAVHLEAAEAALVQVVGLVETEEVLDRVFRSFCVGK